MKLFQRNTLSNKYPVATPLKPNDSRLFNT